MKQLNRDSATERAILIAMSQRDMEGCVEQFTLYNSVCKVLEASSVMIQLAKGVKQPHFENCSHSTLRTKAVMETWHAPFELPELRDAVAGALLLARKELKDENHNK
jgi:hypothetical protein